MDVATYTRIGPAIGYLVEVYDPVSILIFGSYIDGSYTETSDLDCLIILDPDSTPPDLIDAVKDESIIDGIQLDCDICTAKDALEGDVSDFIKAHDAFILYDYGAGYKLVKRVNEYLESLRVTSVETKDSIKIWMGKTLRKLYANTDDSNFRATLLLWESLPNYFFLRDKIYYGSKKSINYIRDNDRNGYELLHQALITKSLDDIYKWATYVLEENHD